MRRILYSIHFVSTPDVEMQHDTYLSLRSARGIRLNARFLFGALLFLVSMFLKANTANRWMALPLGLSAFIMISGIWLLSASGRVVFDRTEHKIFCCKARVVARRWSAHHSLERQTGYGRATGHYRPSNCILSAGAFKHR